MASTTLAASSLLAAPSCFTDRSSLSSSSSPFLDSTLRLAPLKSRALRAALSSPKCSLNSEEQTPSNARRHVLAGMVATGAALAVFANVSLAAVGPGGSGAERTAEKANELLRSADKLNVQDAPKRFSEGGNAASREAEKIAQNAGGGGGGMPDLQKGFKSIFGQGQEKKSEIERGAQDVVGQTQSGGGILSGLQDRVQGLKEGVQQKDAAAKSALQDAESKLPKP